MVNGYKTFEIEKFLWDQQVWSGTSNTWGVWEQHHISDIYWLKIIADSIVKKPFVPAVRYANNIMLWDQTDK